MPPIPSMAAKAESPKPSRAEFWLPVCGSCWLAVAWLAGRFEVLAADVWSIATVWLVELSAITNGDGVSATELPESGTLGLSAAELFESAGVSPGRAALCEPESLVVSELGSAGVSAAELFESAGISLGRAALCEPESLGVLEPGSIGVSDAFTAVL